MVHVAGEVDECFAGVGAQVIDTLVRLGRPLEIDLAAVTFFGAAGVKCLVSLTSSVVHGVRLVRASDASRFVLWVCRVLATADMDERTPAGEQR